ncbi:MAG: signal peptidase I [Clostridia bacterium]|nr:signal peptidase I [Clostridia bacterium]
MDYTVRSTYTRTDSYLWRAADVAVVLVVSVLIVFLLFRFALVPCEVGADSVKELKEGDVVLVDRVSRFFVDYELGDVLNARTEEGVFFLRCAAAGGQEYTVRNGRAYLDGALIDESAYGGSWSEGVDFSVTIPEGSLLLLPDDRSGVLDPERFIFPYSEVYGAARILILPFERFRAFA